MLTTNESEEAKKKKKHWYRPQAANPFYLILRGQPTSTRPTAQKVDGPNKPD